MSDSRLESVPKTQPASAGGPPRPPKKTARGLEDFSPEDPHIELPDPVVVKELAAALREKPFRIVAEFMELGRFVFARDAVDFNTAAVIAKRYGFQARRGA